MSTIDPPPAGRLERIEELLALAQNVAALVQAALGGATIQRGTATLVGGAALAAPATITATSRIVVSFKLAASGVNANTAKLVAENRAVGAPGAFDIVARTIADAQNATDVSQVDWVVVN